MHLLGTHGASATRRRTFSERHFVGTAGISVFDVWQESRKCMIRRQQWLQNVMHVRRFFPRAPSPLSFPSKKHASSFSSAVDQNPCIIYTHLVCLGHRGHHRLVERLVDRVLLCAQIAAHKHKTHTHDARTRTHTHVYHRSFRLSLPFLPVTWNRFASSEFSIVSGCSAQYYQSQGPSAYSAHEIFAMK